MFIIATIARCVSLQLQHDDHYCKCGTVFIVATAARCSNERAKKNTPPPPDCRRRRGAGGGGVGVGVAIDEYELELSGRAPALRETLTSK